MELEMKERLCSCGGGNGPNHPLGEDGCFRMLVTNKEEIPTNRRKWYHPEWFSDSVWV